MNVPMRDGFHTYRRYAQRWGESMWLDKSRTKHNILPVTGSCYNCGVRLRYTGKGAKDRKYYCSLSCMRQRPPKMVLAEMAWGESFDSLALRHLNAGGSVRTLADMCGVHKQAVSQWLRVRGIERCVMWRKRGKEATGRELERI